MASAAGEQRTAAGTYQGHRTAGRTASISAGAVCKVACIRPTHTLHLESAAIESAATDSAASD